MRHLHGASFSGSSKKALTGRAAALLVPVFHGVSVADRFTITTGASPTGDASGGANPGPSGAIYASGRASRPAGSGWGSVGSWSGRRLGASASLGAGR